jgi:hypothetical protein
MVYTYDLKKDLRSDVIGKTIREVVVQGSLPDTHHVEVRFTDNTSLTIRATNYGTLRFES